MGSFVKRESVSTGLMTVLWGTYGTVLQASTVQPAQQLLIIALLVNINSMSFKLPAIAVGKDSTARELPDCIQQIPATLGTTV
jgi:hypothetical protein